jgi:hypothetical protein
MKKIIQHPKICNEENVQYLKMDNEDSFKVLSKNYFCVTVFNPLNAELNPICHLLALLGAHHIFHISRIRVNICHSFFNTNNTTNNYDICEHKHGRQSIWQ